eukprot:COSAG01_NODE_68525_length_264_cov_0.436364_1_plen_29_part_01
MIRAWSRGRLGTAAVLCHMARRGYPRFPP